MHSSKIDDLELYTKFWPWPIYMSVYIIYIRQYICCYIHLTSPDSINNCIPGFPHGVSHGTGARPGTWWCWAAPWPSPSAPLRWPRRQRSARSSRGASCREGWHRMEYDGILIIIRGINLLMKSDNLGMGRSVEIGWNPLMICGWCA